MHSVKRALLAILLMAPLAPIVAQAPQEQPDPEEIVVTGRQFEEQLNDFVDALTPAPRSETIARFEENICPAVRGLTVSQNDGITTRLRAVASAAGMRLGRPGCRANALLIVTDDKSRLISALLRRASWFFGDLTPTEIGRLSRAPGPSAAWQLKELVDLAGHPLQLDPETGYYIGRSTQTSSRTRPSARWVFQGTVLIVERPALDGLNTTQLADFAAMRLFARTDPARLAGTGAPTILNILEAPMGSEIPLTLTTWDLAFLRGLYASSSTGFAASQRSEIRRDMIDALRPEEREE